jgi:hypothetical protein
MQYSRYLNYSVSEFYVNIVFNDMTSDCTRFGPL